MATGWRYLHGLIDDYVEAGLSKFVIIDATGDTTGFVDCFVAELTPRQT